MQFHWKLLLAPKPVSLKKHHIFSESIFLQVIKLSFARFTPSDPCAEEDFENSIIDFGRA